VNPYTLELIELVIKHQIPVLSLSAGNPAPFIPILHRHGIKVIVVVASVKHAQKAEAAGANTLIPSGKVIPPRSLVIGSPGKVVRELTDKDFDLIQLSIDTYVEKSYIYNNVFKK